MRVVVVGGGVIGLLVAMECALAGARVALVEQADLPSPLATSYDRHRVVRALHRGDAALTRAGARAHEAWLALQRRVGTHFYHQVGALTAVPTPELAANLELLTTAGVTGQVLSPGELADRYPRVRFPAGLSAVLDPAAGVVQADRALAALTGWLRGQPGVQLHHRRRVVELDHSGSVRLADGTVLAGDGVVVAAGPYTPTLLPDAFAAEQLTLYRQSFLLYEPGPARPEWAGTPAIPVLGTVHGAWLIPPVADTPVKLSASSACRPVPELSDRVTPDHWRDLLIEEFRRLLTDFDPAAVVGAADGYYVATTADHGPRLTAYGDGAVWAYLACGGLSFKFAPLIAGAIADRVLRRPARLTGLTPIDHPRQPQPSSRGMTL